MKIRTISAACLLFAMFSPATSDACSCIGTDYGFVTSSGSELPANARGLAFSGFLPNNFNQITAEDFRVMAEDFRVMVISDGIERDVPYDLILLDENEGPERMGPYDRLLLVAPRDGLIPGARYRFFHRTGSEEELVKVQERVRRLAVEAPDEVEAQREILERMRRSMAPHDVEVTVSRERFEPKGLLATLEAQTWGLEPLRVARGASCSGLISAAQAEVRMDLPESVARWREAFLFATVRKKDGLWRRSGSVCDQIPPGRSRINVGSELLFQSCATLDDLGLPTTPLKQATEIHEVAMTAWLPGTDLELQAETTVVTECDPAFRETRSWSEIQKPLRGSDPNAALELVEADEIPGSSLLWTRYRGTRPWDGRSIIWRQQSLDEYERLRSFEQAEFTYRVEEQDDARFFWAFHQPHEDENLYRAVVFQIHGDDALSEIETDAEDACGKYLPRSVGHYRSGYFWDDEELRFQQFDFTNEGQTFVRGRAYLAKTEDGFVLRGADCAREAVEVTSW